MEGEYTGKVVRIIDHPEKLGAKCLLVKLDDEGPVVYGWGYVSNYPILNAIQYDDKISFSNDPQNEDKLTELYVIDVD